MHCPALPVRYALFRDGLATHKKYNQAGPMILHWLITFSYLLLFLFLLKKSRFLNDGSLPYQLLAATFVVKVICGIVYGYLEAFARPGGDSMNYFWDANWIFHAF